LVQCIFAQNHFSLFINKGWENLVKSLFPWEVISLHLLGAPYLNVPTKYFFHLFMDENDYLGNQTLNLWAKGKRF
jgi:hypothetical protein